MKEAVEYIISTLYDDLGLSPEDAVDALAQAIKQIAREEGDSELLAVATDQLA